MLNQLEEFYETREEPVKSCLLALRSIILNMNPEVKEHWKFGGPFFYYRNKMTAYFWIDKKTKMPYIGIAFGNFIDHPLLEKGNRKRIKVLPIDPESDLPMETIHEVFQKSFIICDEVINRKLNVYSQKEDVARQLKEILK